jgi:hypothetical protein
MAVKKISKNIHCISLTGKTAEIAVLSDIHWDNPHCDRKLLKKHLNYCKENDIPVVIIGDLFCLMQGRGDNRRNKSDILPEHNNAFYLDSIVDTAVEWFAPYADIIKVIGYGNHETGIIKYQETDLLKRFVEMMNLKYNTDIYTGGYGGWIVYNLYYRKNSVTSFKHKYYHGSGGGGIVTKGALNLTRALEMYEDMDLFTMGHIHENSSRNDVREGLMTYKGNHKIRQRHIHHCITGTYKEEYGDGASGWHIERGAPPKPLGGRIITLSVKDGHDENDKGIMEKKVDSRSFPI